MLGLNEIYNMDCLEGLKALDDNSVDMILCDLPYNETGNEWDKQVLDFNKLWKEYRRIIKIDGAIVLTGTMRFGFFLMNFAKDLYGKGNASEIIVKELIK